jgi:hypothetical protein
MDWKYAEGSGHDLFQGTVPNLPGYTEEKHEKCSQESRLQGWDLNPEPPEYEAGVLVGSRNVQFICMF